MSFFGEPCPHYWGDKANSCTGHEGHAGPHVFPFSPEAIRKIRDDSERDGAAAERARILAKLEELRDAARKHDGPWIQATDASCALQDAITAIVTLEKP